MFLCRKITLTIHLRASPVLHTNQFLGWHMRLEHTTKGVRKKVKQMSFIFLLFPHTILDCLSIREVFDKYQE